MENYVKEWARVAKKLEKNKINNFALTEIRNMIEAYKTGKWYCKNGDYWCQKNREEPHTHFAQNYWGIYDKPKVASFKKEWEMLKYRKGIETLDQLKAMVSKNQEEKIKGTREYTYEGVSNDGRRRDRSVGMEMSSDGDYYYHAASEYSGCGNGSYYLMIDEKNALYMEDD
jgi:hypothetical protein